MNKYRIVWYKWNKPGATPDLIETRSKPFKASNHAEALRVFAKATKDIRPKKDVHPTMIAMLKVERWATLYDTQMDLDKMMGGKND